MAYRFTRAELVRDLEKRYAKLVEKFKSSTNKEDKLQILARMDELREVIFLLHYWEQLHL